MSNEKLLINDFKSNNSEVMSNKQQKILEMAKDICRVKLNCNDVCNPISACDALKYAERAVEAGYSKQSVGEWKLGKSGVMYFCSSCGYAAHPREEEEWDFCPRCGVKMKGGAE